MRLIIVAAAWLALQETVIEREAAPEKVTPKGGLGTADYSPREKEKPFFERLEPLVLVRAYGTVEEEKEGVPRLKVSYMRVFPWKTFTFLKCYGVDRRNETWKKLCEVAEDKIYNPYPDDEYYIKRLGPRPSR